MQETAQLPVHGCGQYGRVAGAARYDGAREAREEAMGVDRTFLFSDIEGSTQKWEAHPALMARALARHDELMTAAVLRQQRLDRVAHR